MQTSADRHNAKRETLEHTVLNGTSLSNSSPQKTPQKRRQNEWKFQRGYRTPEEQNLLIHLSKAHVNSQKLKQQAQDIHGSTPGPLLTYYSFQFNILINF